MIKVFHPSNSNSCSLFYGSTFRSFNLTSHLFVLCKCEPVVLISMELVNN